MAIGAELEAIEAAHTLDDLARRLFTATVDFVKRVAHEHLGGEQTAVLGIGERIQAGQAAGHGTNLTGRVTDAQLADQIGGPGDLAVRPERHVIGHARRRPHERADRAALPVHQGQGLPHHAAGQQPAPGIDAQTVHAQIGQRPLNEGRFTVFRLRRWRWRGAASGGAQQQRGQRQPAAFSEVVHIRSPCFVIDVVDPG